MAVAEDKQAQVRRSRRRAIAAAKGSEGLPHDGLLGFLASCDGGPRPTDAQHLQHVWQEREAQLMGYVNTLQRKLDTALNEIELLKTERTTLEQRLNSYQPRKTARPAAAPSSPKPPKYPRPTLRASTPTDSPAAPATAPDDGGWVALGEYLTSIDTLPMTTTCQRHQQQLQPPLESPLTHPPASPCAQQRATSPLYDWAVALGSPQLDPLSFQSQMEPVEEDGGSAASPLHEVDIFSLFAH